MKSYLLLLTLVLTLKLYLSNDCYSGQNGFKELCEDELSVIASFDEFIDNKGCTINYFEWLRWLNCQGLVNKHWLSSGLQVLRTCLNQGYTVHFSKKIKAKHLRSELFTPLIPLIRKVSFDVDANNKAVLKTFFAACKGLEAVSIFCISLDDKELISLLKGQKNLVKLCISAGEKVTDEGLIFTLSNCPNLVELAFNGCKVTDEGLKYLAKNSGGRFRKLSFIGCNCITYSGVFEILLAGKDLRRLNICYCTKILPDEFWELFGVNESTYISYALSPKELD